MAKIVDILATEHDRSDMLQWNQVHMYKTGQFYTAYDWSAWLIAVISYNDKVRMATNDRHPLAVTRIKMATSDTTFCKVGFPFKSIEKFCPNRQDFDGVENEHITFRIPLPEPQNGSIITTERLREAVNKWTESHPIKEPKKSKEEHDAQKAQRKVEKSAQHTEQVVTHEEPAPPAKVGGGLIHEILAYQLSNSTPTDNIVFIQRLKDMIMTIL